MCAILEVTVGLIVYMLAGGTHTRTHAHTGSEWFLSCAAHMQAIRWHTHSSAVRVQTSTV